MKFYQVSVSYRKINSCLPSLCQPFPLSIPTHDPRHPLVTTNAPNSESAAASTAFLVTAIDIDHGA